MKATVLYDFRMTPSSSSQEAEQHITYKKPYNVMGHRAWIQ